MGGGRWTSNDWDSYATTHVRGKSQSQVFASRAMKPEYDPAQIKLRESRDGPDNPQATPIVLASDVTGSMGRVAEALMRDGLNTLCKEIYDRLPVPDPHVMVMAVGDAYTDRAPLQATQFEADVRLASQVGDLWLEGNGGGNGGESYSSAHLFAATKTSHDAYEKRGRKGFLFTIGDEPIHDGMTRDQIKRVLGLDVEADLSAADCLAMAQRTYDVFHVVIMEGDAGHNLQGVMRTWKPLLPERLLILEDHTKLAETVVSAIQVAQGAAIDAVAGSWKGGTSLVVANALKGIVAGHQGGRGVRRLGA